MQKKLTVKDILDSKGKNKLAEVYTHYSYEAEACELAGIDMIISSENNDVISIRNAAPNTFFTVGLQYGIHLNEYEIINRAFYHLKNGADAIYCPQSERYIKALSDEGIPVVGHTGFIPYKSTFYGGFRAFGKTSKEANKIFDQTKRIQYAGAFAVEIEIVPKKVGEFNEARIIVKNNQVEHWLNGTKILNYEHGSDDVKGLIANSKFASMPLFAKENTGHIGLQHHGEEVWYRNIKIRKL